MAHETLQSPALPSSLSRNELSWLLPQNRKLRNLESISIRNLSLSTLRSSGSRGQTADDNAIPNALRSPAKIVAVREQKALGHSRSSSDLKSVSELSESQSGAAVQDSSPIKGTSREENNGSPKRPPLARPRRRSTLEWASASPLKRQQRLESVAAERMANVFFSLHVQGIQEPVYISEEIQQTMNPTFRGIDLSCCGPGITRLNQVKVRVWAQSEKAKTWQCLLDLAIDMTALQYLGRRLEISQNVFPQNTVIFHLSDGVYTTFSSLSASVQRSMSSLPARSLSQRESNTSSFDALLRLSKLDDSIQDALATRDKLARDLEILLETNKAALAERDQLLEAEDRLQTIDFAKRTVEKQVDKIRRQQEEKKAGLQKRREFMTVDGQHREKVKTTIQTVSSTVLNTRVEHEAAEKAVRNQRRRICENLQDCYPIQPTPEQTLSFSIRGLPLPNSEALDMLPVESTAAALGYVAHALQLLSFYLDRPLPYPVNPKSSTSTIYDPISMLKSNASTTLKCQDERKLRTYPLFAQGVPRFRFEYGVFLLNKNIQVLLECTYNVRVLDIRHTLPNLKYLLYVATAGEGELPARKAGGIRGLLKAPSGDSPALSRTGSNDSQSSGLSGLLWHSRGGHSNGKPRGAVDSLKKSMGHLDGKVRKA